jgi:3-oxoacyl-[acyl-carrier-protein] synthase II
MNRVVITGIGAITPLSSNFRDTWSLIKEGVSGIRNITRFDTSDIPWKVAGEIRDFDPYRYLSKKEILRLDPFIQYAVAASLMAAKDSGLIRQETEDRGTTEVESLDSAAVVIGSSRGGITTLERECQKLYSSAPIAHRLSPFLMPSTTISMASSYVAQKLGIKGHCLGISNACASGANAIGEAFRLIRYGYYDIAFAGGTEAPICRLCVEGYGASGALSKINNSSASRPFDKKRDGFVISEGACILVLEEYRSALKRGANIYAEIVGYSNITDAFHITRPDIEGEARAIELALKDAKISPENIDYINAHGTSTPVGDLVESMAIKKVFKDRDIPLSAIKSMTGHMLAASGAFEIACTAMTIRERIVPPTINVTERDEECQVNLIKEKKKLDVNFALSNSFGFGGVNAVQILKKVDV